MVSGGDGFMFKTDRMIFTINDQPVSSEKILQWEFKRLVKAHRVLTNVYGIHFQDEVTNWIKTKNIKALDDEIMRVKMSIEPDKLREALKSKYDFGNMGALVAGKISGGQRTLCSTEIFVPNSSLTPQQVMNGIKYILLTDNNVNRKMNLAAVPDHFVCRPSEDNIQEVVEIIGNTFVPTHFFIHFDELDGVTSQATIGYSEQLLGTVKLSNGTVIGAVRQQVKSEDGGFRFKAMIEFPKIVPNSIIKDHQMHLACEFGHWISDVLDN